jgi:hypothetical protein
MHHNYFSDLDKARNKKVEVPRTGSIAAEVERTTMDIKMQSDSKS